MAIKSYRDADTKRLADGEYVKRFDSIRQAAQRKLTALAAAKGLADLQAIPGNRLEALSGDLAGQWSIRINEQYRIVITPDGEDFKDVQVIDYH